MRRVRCWCPRRKAVWPDAIRPIDERSTFRESGSARKLTPFASPPRGPLRLRSGGRVGNARCQYGAGGLSPPQNSRSEFWPSPKGRAEGNVGLARLSLNEKSPPFVAPSALTRAGESAVSVRVKRRVVLIGIAAVLVGCGRGEQATAPERGQKAQLLPGQAPAVRRVDLAIPATFDDAGMFAEGLAPVRVGGKFGYIDTRGNLAIQPQFDFATRFSEGLAAAGIGGKEGYIDKSGKFVLTPQFEIADLQVFSEGLAPVRIGEFVAGKWGYIDKSGNVVIQPQFDAAGPFSGGLAVAAIGNKFGYIDRTGKVVIALQYDLAGSFSGGLAAVRIGDPVSGKTGYIDSAGKMVIAPQFDGAFSFADGLAAVRVRTKYGFIDKSGRLVIPARLDFADSFSGPVAAFRQGADLDGKYGYIDRKGNVVIDPQFDFADLFSKQDGLAAVRIGDEKTGKWGYVAAPGVHPSSATRILLRKRGRITQDCAPSRRPEAGRLPEKCERIFRPFPNGRASYWPSFSSRALARMICLPPGSVA